MSPSEPLISNLGTALITEGLKAHLEDAGRRRELLDRIALGMPRKARAAVGQWLLQPGVVPALLSEDQAVRAAVGLRLADLLAQGGVEHSGNIEILVSSAAAALVEQLPATPEIRALRDELSRRHAELLSILAAPLLFRDVLYASCLRTDGMPVLVSPELELAAFGEGTVGVNPAGIEGEPTYLDYVPRDDDGKLRAALQEAISDRRMLLVIGESAAGKSRSTAEAIRDLLGGRALLHPRPGALRDLLSLSLDGHTGAVIWVDDAQHYADPALGDTLQLLLDWGHAVIGTIRRAELERLSPVGDVRNPAGEALNDPGLVRQQPWLMEWTAEERARVAEVVSDDATNNAVSRGIPLGAWCVAGPQLLARLEQARLNEAYPVRFALVESVLAWYRTGIGKPMPRELALAHAGRSLGGPCGADDLSDALTWACESVIGRGQLARHALLQSDEAGETLSMHDYVLNHDQRQPGDRAVPDAVWTSALQHAGSAEEQWGIAVSAFISEQFDFALQVLRPLAAQGDPTALFDIGVTLDRLRRKEDALAAYEGVVARYGDIPVAGLRTWAAMALVNMGGMLKELDRGEEAVAAYEQVVARYGDDPDAALRVTVAKAMVSLGGSLRELDRGEDAVAAYEQVMARYGDDPDAALREVVAKALYNLGVFWGDLGRGEDAVAAYQQVVTRYGDDPDATLRHAVATAMVNLGASYWELGRGEDAVAVFEQVVTRYGDDPDATLREAAATAMMNMGVSYWELGRGEDAVAASEQVVTRYGDDPNATLREAAAMAMVNLGASLWELGRGEDALSVCEQMVARYDHDPAMELRDQVSRAYFNMGVMLRKLGRGEESLAAHEHAVARVSEQPATEQRERVAMALLDMAATLGEFGRHKEAAAAYGQVVARYGDDPEPALRRVVAEAKRRRGNAS